MTLLNGDVGPANLGRGSFQIEDELYLMCASSELSRRCEAGTGREAIGRRAVGQIDLPIQVHRRHDIT